MQQQSKWVFDVWLRRAYIKKMNGELDNLKEKICKGEYSYLFTGIIKIR